MSEVESAPILAEPHFYWGACYVCRRKSTKENSMKRCTRCKSVYYCSQVELPPLPARDYFQTFELDYI